MLWQEILESVCNRTGASRQEVEQLLDTFCDVVAEAMEEEEKVQLRRDLGTFVVREHGGNQVSERREMYVKRQRSVVFKASNDLKKRLRQDDEDYVKMLQSKGAQKQLEILRLASQKAQ